MIKKTPSDSMSKVLCDPSAPPRLAYYINQGCAHDIYLPISLSLYLESISYTLQQNLCQIPLITSALMRQSRGSYFSSPVVFINMSPGRGVVLLTALRCIYHQAKQDFLYIQALRQRVAFTMLCVQYNCFSSSITA